MKLPQLPQDKANHIIYGFSIFIISELVFLVLSLIQNEIINTIATFKYSALVITIIAASVKEFYDEKEYGGFDWKDLLATIIPALILTVRQFF